MGSIKEGPTPLNSLPYLLDNKYCQEHVLGKCQLGDQCPYPHQIGQVPTRFAHFGKIPAFEDPVNTLLSELQYRPIIAGFFDSDGPGNLAKLGPRHNNDHEEIEHIKILPTVDEILSMRPPYLPLKNPDHANDRLQGKSRLLDAQFRHLRYDSVESIRDVCYHAAQDLAKPVAKPCAADYDVRQFTPQGNQYSLFRNIRLEDLMFDRNGIHLQLSFNCPRSLERDRLASAGHLEKGMLVALIGLNKEHHLSVTYFNIEVGQSTGAMKSIYGNHDKASAWLSFAEPSDTDTIRKLLHSLQGLSSPESFVLVEFPKLLYAGFSWALKHLQNLKSKDTDIAFSEFVAPSHPSSRREIPAPQYTQSEKFAFDLSVIQNRKPLRGSSTAKFNPQRTAQTPESIGNLLETVKSTTTLDDGQAIALCDCLLRSFSFVKGPPGTGKSFLGTALAQVILKANPTQPILVVCQTNKALDGFLEDLLHKGITEIARLGQGSKEDWTGPYNIRTLRNHANKVREEQRLMREARMGMQGLHKEGVGRCDALKSKGLTWNAVKSFFKVQYPEIFQSFNSIKSPHDEELNDLHRARSGDGGYAFEYWCTGGDINDIEGFRDYVKSMLEACGPPSVSSTSESSLSVPDQIRGDNSRAMSTHESVHHNVWALSLAEREQLITKWKAELGPYAAVDKLVEVHRRFCIVKDMQRQAQLNIDARLIKDKQIIGVTTTACAQDWSMLEGLNLSTVICEEAGEITEAQTLTTLLPSIKHAIFIGDPDQLRPQLNQPSLSMATETGRLYRLDESLFERMVSPRSPEVNALPYSTLSVQRRMHPDIADLMRATEYPFLKDHASTARPPVAGMVHRTFWFDHQHPEDRVETLALDSTSYSNAYECDMICEMVRHLLKTNDFGREDITILCPYNKQLANIRAKLTKASKCSIFLSDTDKEYLVDTRALPEEELRSSSRSSVDLASMVRLASVDGFQGQESKVVILSAVRSNPQDRTGFLSITNRINVACSRARNGFYILGNSNLLKTVPMWEAIINDFERKGRLGTSFQLHCSRHPNQISAVGIPNDFGKALDCEMRCSYILNCGHQCPEKCHKPELHPRIRCGRPCWKRHPGCGSQCTNQCGEPCNTCETTLSKSILSCGHEYSITCTGAQQRTCEAILETIVLSCGHAVERTCSKQDQFPDCQDRCSFILDCGHQCSGKCSECRINNSHAKCTAVCGRRLGCDHTCATKCHKGTCPPCQVRCKTFCEHGACSNVCGMICVPCVKGCLKSSCIHGGCTTICCLPCQDLPCNQPCTQLLPCSHVCPGLCGEECCTDCLECETGTCPTDTKMFLSCGHVFNVADLDTKFNLRHLFEINDDGSIEDFRRLSKREDIEVPQCPQCGTIVTNRRYSIFQQLIDEPNTIDRIYNMLGQKLRGFMLSLQDQKKSLEQGVNGFLNELKQGPLVGKTNGELIKSRVAMILPLRTELNKFRDEVVVEVEDALCHRLDWANDYSIGANLPFKLRLDYLDCQCSLIGIQDWMKIASRLQDSESRSQHTNVMIDGLQTIATRQAAHCVATLEAAITKCVEKGLKRLEAEMRLLQVCFQMTLATVNHKPQDEISETLNTVSELCMEYPTSAGVLRPVLKSVQRKYQGRQSSYDIFNTESSLLWVKWGNYTLGSLKYCRLGHPYSGADFPQCPECGKRALSPARQAADTLRPQLQERKFLKMLHEMTEKRMQKRAGDAAGRGQNVQIVCTV